VLAGDLEEFTLPDILRFLASACKTGRLALQRAGGAGRIDLTDGRVREASADADRLAIARRLLGAGLVSTDDLTDVLRGGDSLPSDLELARSLGQAGLVESGTLAEVVREQSLDAVSDLLRWEEGSFRFEGGTPDLRGEQVLDLTVPVDELLAEAHARLGSWRSAAERTGDADGVVTIARPRGERTQVSLPPDGWWLLSLVDGRRTVADLAQLSGQGDYRTRRTLVALIDEGFVDVGGLAGPSQVERLLADHDRLAALERELGRARRPADPPVSSPPASPPTASNGDATQAPRPGSDERHLPEAAPLRANGRTTRTAAGGEPGQAAARSARLRRDPRLDADLVRRLIDEVESL
jgi:hypothetical protein